MISHAVWLYHEALLSGREIVKASEPLDPPTFVLYY